jgi:hypothetical protein
VLLVDYIFIVTALFHFCSEAIKKTLIFWYEYLEKVTPRNYKKQQNYTKLAFGLIE